jgi:hypothetical protein
MKNPIHTSDSRHFLKLWYLAKGWVEPIRGTGEILYGHVSMPHPVRANGRRKDVPAVLLSKLNQLMKTEAANDPYWECGN